MVRGQRVRGGGDLLTVQAQADAEHRARQAAGVAQLAAQRAGGGAGRGAGLVAHDGAAAGQRLAQRGGAGVERDQGDRLGALGQRDPGPRGQVLHGGDARDRLHPHVRDQLAHGLGQVAERGVQVGIAQGAERDRGRSLRELGRHRGAGGLPGRGPARCDPAGVVQRERHPLDPAGGHVLADDRLGPAGLGIGAREHRDHDHVGLAQHPDGLDRDELGVAGADADPG